MGLSTHVLDTMHGRPAAGMAVTLVRLEDAAVLVEAVTNADGRLDVPLLDDDSIAVGRYELRFAVGDYFAGQVELPEPAFLDEVPIRFAVSDVAAHYHVPLLVTPWGYTTYRGS